MLIKIAELLSKFKIAPQGVIHVGAHFGEEAEDYKRWGFREMVFIEPCGNAFREMLIRHDNLKDLPIQYFNVGCGDIAGKFTMNVTRQAEGQSNSLLTPKLHLKQHPEIKFTDTEQVEIWRLDDMPLANRFRFNVLNMDVQGYELRVLRGATHTLRNIEMVYSEVNCGQTYEGNGLIEEQDAFLEPYGFERVETCWPSANWTWGDAVWIKTRFMYTTYKKDKA